MRKLLLLAALAAGGVVGTSGAARAEGDHHWGPVPIIDIHRCLGPKSTSVTWPSVSPPGWYTNTYRHKWFYPWYAYYDFTHGPYANWMASGGYAGYAYHGPAGYYYYPGLSAPAAVAVPAVPVVPAGPVIPPPKKEGGTLTISLPADARLLFNGVAAGGTGGVRTFQTPPLEAGQSYQYTLTAEVVRDGRTERATGTVIERAGETSQISLSPNGVTTASK